MVRSNLIYVKVIFLKTLFNACIVVFGRVDLLQVVKKNICGTNTLVPASVHAKNVVHPHINRNKNGTHLIFVTSVNELQV